MNIERTIDETALDGTNRRSEEEKIGVRERLLALTPSQRTLISEFHLKTNLDVKQSLELGDKLHELANQNAALNRARASAHIGETEHAQWARTYAAVVTGAKELISEVLNIKGVEFDADKMAVVYDSACDVSPKGWSEIAVDQVRVAELCRSGFWNEYKRRDDMNNVGADAIEDLDIAIAQARKNGQFGSMDVLTRKAFGFTLPDDWNDLVQVRGNVTQIADGREYVESAAAAGLEPEFWGVYAQQQSLLHSWLADFDTEEEANKVAQRLLNIAAISVGTSNAYDELGAMTARQEMLEQSPAVNAPHKPSDPREGPVDLASNLVVRELMHQRDVLMRAIADTAQSLGLVGENAVLEGPHLLMLLDDMKLQHEDLRRQFKEGQFRQLPEILQEASRIIEAIDPESAPDNIRWPIADELDGFASMLKDFSASELWAGSGNHRRIVVEENCIDERGQQRRLGWTVWDTSVNPAGVDLLDAFSEEWEREDIYKKASLRGYSIETREESDARFTNIAEEVPRIFEAQELSLAEFEKRARVVNVGPALRVPGEDDDLPDTTEWKVFHPDGMSSSFYGETAEGAYKAVHQRAVEQALHERLVKGERTILYRMPTDKAVSEHPELQSSFDMVAESGLHLATPPYRGEDFRVLQRKLSDIAARGTIYEGLRPADVGVDRTDDDELTM